MSDPKKPDFEELSIGTEAGLRAFLANANAQYRIGLEREAERIEQGDYEYGSTLHDTFARVRSTTNTLLDKVRSDKWITDDDAELLQHEYDRLVRLLQQAPTNRDTRQDSANTNTNTPPTEKSVVTPNRTETKPAKKTEERQAEETPKKAAVTLADALARASTKEEVVPAEPKTESVSKTASKSDKSDKSPKAAEPKKPRVEKQWNDSTSNETTRPKTGGLRVTSDDAVVDMKDQLEVRSEKPKPSAVKTHQPATPQKPKKDTDSVYRSKIESLVADSTKRYQALSGKVTEPDAAQSLLFTEVQESIEQLEILSKKTDITEKQFTTVAQLVAHISYALQAIEEYRPVIKLTPKPHSVPVVTEQAAETIEVDQPNQYPTVSFVPTSVTNVRPSVANRMVPKQLQTLPKPAEIHEPESLTERYLTAPAEQAFILQHYSSLKSFERILDATVTKIEADTIDSIEKWLGDLPASAFAFIKDMPVTEVQAFANRPYDFVRADLVAENIKYETFTEWRDVLPEMITAVAGAERMTFGQLYAKWMISIAMSEG